jgi:hypothetical protein
MTIQFISSHNAETYKAYNIYSQEKFEQNSP